MNELDVVGLSLGVEELRARVDGVGLPSVLDAQGGDVAANHRRGLEQLDIELPRPVLVDLIRGEDASGSSADDDYGGEGA